MTENKDKNSNTKKDLKSKASKTTALKSNKAPINHIKSEPKSPSWAIRGVSLDIKEQAIKEAQDKKISLGKWIEEAILEKIEKDIDDELFNSVENKVEENILVEDLLSIIDRAKEKGIKFGGKLVKKTNKLIDKLIEKIDSSNPLYKDEEKSDKSKKNDEDK